MPAWTGDDLIHTTGIDAGHADIPLGFTEQFIYQQRCKTIEAKYLTAQKQATTACSNGHEAQNIARDFRLRFLHELQNERKRLLKVRHSVYLGKILTLIANPTTETACAISYQIAALRQKIAQAASDINQLDFETTMGEEKLDFEDQCARKNLDQAFEVATEVAKAKRNIALDLQRQILRDARAAYLVRGLDWAKEDPPDPREVPAEANGS